MIYAAAVAHDVRGRAAALWSAIAGAISDPGRNAGCTTILVNAFPDPPNTRIEPDMEFPDLAAAARWILTAPST